MSSNNSFFLLCLLSLFAFGSAASLRTNDEQSVSQLLPTMATSLLNMMFIDIWYNTCLPLLLHQQRKLQFDSLFPTDLCKNGPGDDDIGPCDLSRFPICEQGEVRCYNRKVWRDKFHTDIMQPMFYIDYDLVLCYPEDSGACSSCSPGRYCRAENRCILDELNYACAAWL